MQAVILAAGKGTRLRPLTNDIPKPLIRVGGKPIIEYTLSALPKEIDEAFIVIGYKGDVVRGYLGNEFVRENGEPIRLSYIEQEEQNGTGHALLAARPHLNKGLFLLLNSDDLYHPEDLGNAVSKKGPAVLVRRSESPERFGVCLVNREGCIQEILEKRENPPTDLVNIGAYVLHHDIFIIEAPILPNGELNLAEQVGNWAKTRPVYAVEARFWQPINNLEELEIAEKILTASNI